MEKATLLYLCKHQYMGNASSKDKTIGGHQARCNAERAKERRPQRSDHLGAFVEARDGTFKAVNLLPFLFDLF